MRTLLAWMALAACGLAAGPRTVTTSSVGRPAPQIKAGGGLPALRPLW